MFNYQQICDSDNHLSVLLCIVYFATIKMAVLLSTILLIAKRNDQQKMQISRVTFMFQLIKVGEIHQFSLTICSFLAELC